MRSASASLAAVRISSTGSPRRTVVVTRRPLARSSEAAAAKYVSASSRSFSTSSIATAPSMATGGDGTITRTSVTCMSSGPAISRMNGRIDSATAEPSRGISARLYMSRPPGQLGAARNFQRRTVGADDENRRGRASQHRFGDAAEDEPPQTASPVRGHHVQIDLLRRGGFDDRSSRRAVPHVGLGAPETTIVQPPDNGGQVLLGFANRRHLGLDLVGTGQRMDLRRSEQTERGSVLLGEIEGVRKRCFGQDGAVQCTMILSSFMWPPRPLSRPSPLLS